MRWLGLGGEMEQEKLEGTEYGRAGTLSSLGSASFPGQEDGTDQIQPGDRERERTGGYSAWRLPGPGGR